jgi:hypothetical protein
MQPGVNPEGKVFHGNLHVLKALTHGWDCLFAGLSAKIARECSLILDGAGSIGHQGAAPLFRHITYSSGGREHSILDIHGDNRKAPHTLSGVHGILAWWNIVTGIARGSAAVGTDIVCGNQAHCALREGLRDRKGDTVSTVLQDLKRRALKGRVDARCVVNLGDAGVTRS